MLKFFLITFLIFYLIYKVVGFLFRVFITKMVNGSQTTQKRASQSRRKRHVEGNVDIDYIPEDTKVRDFKGGDYVDYEEVK